MADETDFPPLAESGVHELMQLAADSPVSSQALKVLGVLKAHGADHPERAICDRDIAREAGVSVREVIERVRELTRIDVAVLASCGKGRSGRRGKGRFICAHARMVHEYADKLHRRAKTIHGTAADYSGLARRMDAKRSPDSTGQLRLNGQDLQDRQDSNPINPFHSLGAFA